MLAKALMPLLATLAQPAETVTQAVVSVAKTGQRRISADVRRKVKALRAHNGGPLHSHDPTWKLIDDGIVTEQGDLIADAMAPTATKVTTTKDAPTDKQLDKFNEAVVKSIDKGDDALAAKAKQALASGEITKGNVFDWINSDGDWSLKDGS